MTERERRLDAFVVVPPVADEQSFAVGHVIVHAGVEPERRRVLQAARHGDGQPTTGLGTAEQHVDERLPELLAGEPHLQHCSHVVEPGHGDG